MPNPSGNIQAQQFFDVGNILQSIRVSTLDEARPFRPKFAFVQMAKDHFVNKTNLPIIYDAVSKEKKILMRKQLPLCDQDAVKIDFCNTQTLPSNLQDTVKQFYLPINKDSFEEFYTKHISITENSWRDLMASGGVDGIKNAINTGIISGFHAVYSKIDKWIADSIFLHKGCYADNSNTTKSINLFLTEANGLRTLNPQAFSEIETANELDENPAPYTIKIGGTTFKLAEKIIPMTVPNTAIGIDQSVGMKDKIKQTYISNKITSVGNDGAEKLFNIDPRSIQLINYVNETMETGGINSVSAFGNANDLGAWDTYISNLGLLIKNGAKEQTYSFLFFDPVYGFRWKGDIIATQCGGQFNIIIQFSTQLALLFTNKGDLSCTNRCATGIEMYNVCVPEPQPSCAPTTMPVLPPSLCVYATMPTPCNYTIAKGDTLSLDFGGTTYQYVMPYTLVFEDIDAVLANIQSMFTNYPERGRFVHDASTKQWLYFAPFQTGITNTNALYVGIGNLNASCFSAPIIIELRNCDTNVMRTIPTRAIEMPITSGSPANFVNTTIAKSVITVDKNPKK